LWASTQSIGSTWVRAPKDLTQTSTRPPQDLQKTSRRPPKDPLLRRRRRTSEDLKQFASQVVGAKFAPWVQTGGLLFVDVFELRAAVYSCPRSPCSRHCSSMPTAQDAINREDELNLCHELSIELLHPPLWLLAFFHVCSPVGAVHTRPGSLIDQLTDDRWHCFTSFEIQIFKFSSALGPWTDRWA